MRFDEILDCTAGVGVLAARLKIFHERPEHMRRDFKIFRERANNMRLEFIQFRGGEAADVLEAEMDTRETAGGKEPQKCVARRGNSEEVLG